MKKVKINEESAIVAWIMCWQVHGGTSYKDIEKKVEQAEAMARVNEGLNMDTVLFFDEANTTDALGTVSYTHLTLPTIYSV